MYTSINSLKQCKYTTILHIEQKNFKPVHVKPDTYIDFRNPNNGKRPRL